MARIEVVRVYEDPGRVAGDRRVLVDRLWPRGLRKEGADLDDWMKDVAPSAELRRWYGHAPERFDEFAQRYRRELGTEPAATALSELRRLAGDHRIVLLTATLDVERSGAEVLRQVITGKGHR